MTNLIVITGPTATGKSALALKIAEERGGEIISGDSVQVYRGMDIGSAKASAAERASVPHHLIDILDIDKPFSAGAFVPLAAAAIDDINSRGRVPIIAGGTGLYIDALTGPALAKLPESDPEIRRSLLESAEREGPAAFHKRLAAVDPKAAEEIHPNNVKRVARAMEIYLITGKTKSALCEEQRSEVTIPARGRGQRSERGFLSPEIYLLTCDRDLLYTRIDRRVDEMVRAGLVEEAEGLWRAGLAATPTASQAIGYKELFPYFEGNRLLSDCVADIKQATRNYAKRQVTYFKRMSNAVVIDCTLSLSEQWSVVS